MRHLLMAATAAAVFAAPAEAALIRYYGTGNAIGGFLGADGQEYSNFAELALDIVLDTGTMSCGSGVVHCSASVVSGELLTFRQVASDGSSPSFSISLRPTQGADLFRAGQSYYGWFNYTSPTARALGATGGIGIVESAVTDRLPSATVSLAAVPEPASWATMIAGFGLLGGAMRRRPRHATS